MKYDNKVKFKVIEEICSGKSYADVKKEYEISHNSITEWFHKFIEDDLYLLDKDLVNGDISRIIYLKKIAKEREVEIRRHGNSTNADMSWVLQFNNELSEWVNLSNDWLQTIIRGKSTSIRALTNFYKKYLIPCNITTLRLIDKCQKISKNTGDVSNKAQLVPVGTVQDVGFLLESEADEMYQLQAICNGAELFPETDASKALLKRTQIIDLTLMFNQKQPVLFTLSEDEQLLAGNQFMRLLIKRAGSLKEAIPYAIGRKKLEEIGIYNEFTEELKGIEYASQKALLTDNSAS